VPTTWVVKLGGSLADSETLPLWLDSLADAPAVIVPGGGPFADRVRLAQDRWRFDDRSAHAMAILAMAQYGLMLAGLCPRLRASSAIDSLRSWAKSGTAAVWLPDLALLDEPEIPASWTVTSDSLAAWLARRVGADHLLLVKSAATSANRTSVEKLSAEGIIDAAFGSFAVQAQFGVWLCRSKDHKSIPAGLANPDGSFVQVMN
jgi:aspartokinase-like uncharacterized kinase